MSNAEGERIDFAPASAGELFNGDFLFKIPFFQRDYIWGESLWKKLLENMETISKIENRKEHFMGFIILKKESKHPNAPYLIIDGQQRLTTFILLAQAYYRITGEDPDVIVFHGKNDVPILDHNHHDEKIFKAILSGKNLSEKDESEHSNSKVLQCFQYYFNDDEEMKRRIKKIDFNKVLNKLSFAYIILTAEQDEQEIFDTMNSLLAPLGTADLLKNYFFNSNFGLENAEKIYEDTWKKTFERDPETKEYWRGKVDKGRNIQPNLEMLLRAYLVIKTPETKEYKAHSALFDKYKEFLEETELTKKEVIYEIMEYAEEYREHIKAEFLNGILDSKSLTQRLNIVIFGLKITTVIPYILYILRTVQSDEEKKRIFNLLESYLMRRRIAGINSDNYNKFFIQAINREYSYETLKEKIYSTVESEEIPDDELFKNGFEGKRFVGTTARTILYLLEYEKQPPLSSGTLIPYSNYTVEHVMPKNWRRNWKDHLPEASNKEAEIEMDMERDKKVHRLGNLILLKEKLNNQLSDAWWENKKEGFVKGRHKIDGLNQCCDNLKTFKQYLMRDNWDENTIIERDKELFDIATKLWSYDKKLKAKIMAQNSNDE